MTTYHVQAGAAGENGTLPTLAAAARLVQPGDEVIVGPGIYRERLVCDVAGVVWRAEPPLSAIIDGGWDGRPVANEYTALVALPAPGVTVQGFTICNSPGRGITVGGDRCIVAANVIDNCYSGGLIATGCANILIERNELSRLGMSWTAGQRDMVSGSLNLIRVTAGVVRGNVVSGGYGEGINCGKGSIGCLIEGNIVSDCAHLAYYFNRCIDCELRGNVAVLTLDPAYDEGELNVWPAAYVFGDEVASDRKGDTFPYQERNRLIGNVAVGYGTLLHVRNNRPSAANPTSGYDTQLNGCVIEHNTLIGGPGTRAGIFIQENQRGRPHRDTVLRYNVIHFDHAQAGAEIGRTAGPGVAFERNAWTRPPPDNMASAADVVGDLMLVNPGAPIEGSGAAGLTRFSLDDYRPAPLSPLVGVGPDGVTLGALSAGSIDPPPPPPPPPVDWAALVADAQAAAQELVDLTAHGSSALDDLALQLSNVAAARQEMDEIARHAGEARLKLDALLEKIEGYQTG